MFKLIGQEFGRGEPTAKSFETLADLAEAVKEQWEGAEYIDGPASFHTDYMQYTLEGATLKDLGKFKIVDGCREFKFN